MRLKSYEPSIESKNILNLNEELEKLLKKYLDTVACDESPSTEAEFALPRNEDVDEYLRRVEIDGDKSEQKNLEETLKNYIHAIESGQRQLNDLNRWRKRTASDIHRMVSVEDRVKTYANHIAIEDEEIHMFTDGNNPTLKGPVGDLNPPIWNDTIKRFCINDE